MKQKRRARGTGRVYKENGVYLLQYTTKDHKRKAMILRDESGAKITEERRAEAAARDFLERKIKRIDSHEKNSLPSHTSLKLSFLSSCLSLR